MAKGYKDKSEDDDDSVDSNDEGFDDDESLDDNTESSSSDDYDEW